MDMVENAAEGTAGESAVDGAVNDIRGHKALKTDARLNASVPYGLTEGVSATLYALNLLGMNDNKRYTYDTGVNSAAPNQVSRIEEPRVIGLRLESRFQRGAGKAHGGPLFPRIVLPAAVRSNAGLGDASGQATGQGPQPQECRQRRWLRSAGARESDWFPCAE